MGKKVVALQMAFLPFLLPPVRQFLDSLHDRGYDVTLIKSYPRDRRRAEEARPKLNNVMMELHLRKLPKKSFVAPLVFLEFVLRSIPAALRAKPDIVISFDVDTLLQGYLVSRLRRAKLIYYSIELYTERPGFRPKALWVWLERLLINKAHLVIACEPNRARVMQEKYWARELPMTVLNVPPYQEATRTNRVQQVLEERGLAGKKVALYVGELNRARCIDEFIEASKYFHDNIVLFLVGPTGHGYDIQAKIAEAGAQDQVIVHPPVQPHEVMEFTSSADLGLQTQKNDGLNHYYCAPIKLFQYLMAGLPVLSSNFPGMLEVVEGNEIGLCVDPEDPRTIADAINKILGDDALHAHMAQNALRAAREKYCYEIEGAPLLNAVDVLANA